MLLCNLHAIHHDNRYWSEPQKFDPARFLERGEGLKNMREGKFVPFNAPRGPGTRGCVAKNFALGALVVIISNVVRLCVVSPLSRVSDTCETRPHVHDLIIS